jgi:hypothetical protein
MSEEFSEAYHEVEVLRQNLHSLQNKLMEQAALLRALEDSEVKIKRLLMENESLKRELTKQRQQDSSDLNLLENILNDKQLAEAKARHSEQQLVTLQQAYQLKEAKLNKTEHELRLMERKLQGLARKEVLVDAESTFKAIKEKEAGLPVKRRAAPVKAKKEDPLDQFPRPDEAKRRQKRQGVFMEPYAPSSSVQSEMFTPAYAAYEGQGQPIDPLKQAFLDQANFIRTLVTQGFEVGSTNASMWADTMLKLKPDQAASFYSQEIASLLDNLRASSAVELTHCVFESFYSSKDWFMDFLRTVKEFAVSLTFNGKTFTTQDHPTVKSLQELLLEAYLDSARELRLFPQVRSLVCLLSIRQDFATYAKAKLYWPSLLTDAALKSLKLLDAYLADHDIEALLTQCVDALNVYNDNQDLYRVFKTAFTILQSKPAYGYYSRHLWPLLSQRIPGRAVIIMTLGHVLKQLSADPVHKKVIAGQISCLKEIVGDSKYTTFTKDEQEAARFSLAKVGQGT